MKSNHFRGLGTALVTPFDSEGVVDIACMRSLAERQIVAGVDMLVACGTTGEAVTLDDEEYSAIVDAVVLQSNGRVPVVAGAGSNSTKRTIETARRAAEAGADALLIVTPYYNKPTQEGLYKHYVAVSQATALPIILYNVPGRTSCNMSAETQLLLARIDTVIGTKEASGNMSQIMEIISNRPEGFRVFSGDDNLTLPLLSVGADGVISTISNELPSEFASMVHLGMEGRYQEARDIHYSLLELMEANFIESNPGPVKCAMAIMGLLEERYRLPIVPLTASHREHIRSILRRMNIQERDAT